MSFHGRCCVSNVILYTSIPFSRSLSTLRCQNRQKPTIHKHKILCSITGYMTIFYSATSIFKNRIKCFFWVIKTDYGLGQQKSMLILLRRKKNVTPFCSKKHRLQLLLLHLSTWSRLWMLTSRRHLFFRELCFITRPNCHWHGFSLCLYFCLRWVF